MIKIKQKLLSLFSMLFMVAGILAILSTTARAETLPYGMTSSSIGVGSGNTLASSTTQIGFGGQRWYVVGFNGIGINKGNGCITLLTKGSMGSSVFSDSGSTSYSGSTLQTFINALPNSYDSREQSIMVGLTLDEVSGTSPANQKIWALGATEASTVSSSVRELANSKLEPQTWVLRTMSQYGTARTVSGGVVNNYGPPNAQPNCVRPGTVLDLSKVLYTSPISGTKDTTVGTMNSVALSSEVKFTILDPSLSLSIDSAPGSLTKEQGSSISLDYSGAQIGTGKYVSCVLVSNTDSMVKYYAKLSTSASGTLSIPISMGIIAGSYTLLIYNEEIHSGDNSDYASTPVSIGLTVTGSSNTAPTLRSGVLSTAKASVSVNSAYTLNLADIFTDINGNALTYRVYINGSSTAVPADANYSFTPGTAGTNTLRFTAYDGAAESTSYTVTLKAVNVLATGITVTGENGATCIGMNGSLQLHYSIQPSNTTDQTVSWKVTMSDGFAKGNIDAANMLRTSGVDSAGTVTVRATAKDGSGKFGELVLTILTNVVNGITLDTTKTDFAVSDTTQMSATVSPSNAEQEVTWSISSGSSIASVSTSGLVTFSGSGNVTVRATAKDGSGIYGEKTLTVKGLQAAPSVPTMASKTATTITLNAITGAEYSADGHTWQSGTTFTNLKPNTTYSFYARMSETSTMKASLPSSALSVTTEKAVLSGPVSISGTFKCGQNINVNTNGLTANPSSSLGTISYQWTRDGSNISGATGSTYSLITDDVGKVINVTVSTENCTGTISSGNTTATQKGDSYTTPTGLKAAFGDTLKDVVLPDGFKWEALLTTSVGEIGDNVFTVTYTPTDTDHYNIVTNISVTITVEKKSPVYTAPAAETITYGQTLADSALSGGEASVLGSFTWTIGTIKPAVTDSNVTEYSVTFTPTDMVHYKTINFSVKLTVNKATPFITSVPTASAITYGQTLSDSILSGGNGSAAGSFAWTNGATKPSVSDSNATTYSVTFTPTDTENYNSKTTMVKLTVNKATPSIASTPTASAITYGQTLASSTLSGGVSSVPGSFAWTTGTTKPAASDSNTTEYSVNFTPTDTANYNTTATTVKLKVYGTASSIITAPTASAIMYGQTLSDSILSGGSGSVEGSFAWANGAIKPSVTDSNKTTYSVIFTPTDDNYAPSSKTVTLTVNKAISSIAAPTSGIVTDGDTNTFSFTVVSGYETFISYEYSTNGTTWTALSSSNATLTGSTITISVGNIASNVQVRVKESESYTAGAVLTSSAFIASLEGSVAITGTAKYGQMITANVTGAQSNAVLSYVWKAGGTQISLTNVNTLKLDMDGLIGKTITVEVSAPPYAGMLTSTETAAVGKDAPLGSPSYSAITTGGKTLADATLAIGSLKPNTVGYTLKWVDDKGEELGGTTEVKANTAYKWLFTPKDAANYDALSGTITLYNVSTSGGEGGSSGGSTNTNTDNITVPISSSDTIMASVSGDTATVTASDAQLKEITSGSATEGTVKIDLSSLKVDAAIVPAKVLSAVQSAEGSSGLEVVLPTGTVILDKSALEAVSDKGDIKLSVETVDNSKLSDAQKAVLGTQASSAVVVDVNVFVNGTQTSTFGDGKISVSVPYTPKPGQKTDSITVWFIKDNGTIEPKNGVYNAVTGCVKFTTEHLSQYLIVNFPFADVNENTWYYGNVAYAYNNGLFAGTSATNFSPDTAMTRQMIWMVMARMDGKTPANMEEARTWAMENGISDGSSPASSIAREQMAAILYRYAKYKGYDTTQGGMAIREFSDYDNISDYALPALGWAVNTRLIQGSSNNLMPKGHTTRAQATAILQRFCQDVAK